MVDANRCCFANPSITKRRTERVRRFKRVRHDCYDSRAAEEIRRGVGLAADFDVIGDGGALFVAFRLDLQDRETAFVEFGQGFFQSVVQVVL
jgi:hypothetical protein